jgi:hypothetical protein
MTEIQIANMALTMLGADTITAFTDSTEQARAMTAVYDYIRTDMLAEYPWSWAIKRDQLDAEVDIAGDAVEPEYGYSYQFDLPADYVRILEVSTGSVVITNYRIEGDKILADYDEIYVKYIAEVADDAITDLQFANAFATRLAAELAYKLTSNSTLASNLAEMAMLKLSKAKAANAQESNSIDAVDADEWELGRAI